ncbi:hypothetical protein PAXRUDRAFT_826163, partial [Paxillus rubicundulus Ve08.2h10]
MQGSGLGWKLIIDIGSVKGEERMANSLTPTPRLSVWPVFRILASGVADPDMNRRDTRNYMKGKIIGVDQSIFRLSIGYMNLSHSSTCPYPKRL